MRKPNKKQKITAIFAGLVAVCALSLGGLYVSGVLPAQGKGETHELKTICINKDCDCHTGASHKKCHECDQCCPTIKTIDEGKGVKAVIS